MNHKSHSSEDGQGLVEYALILVLIALAAIFVISLLGNQLNTVYVRVVAALNGQVITGEGHEYIITGFSASATGSAPLCSVTVSNIGVMYLIDGEPAPSGTSVSVTVQLSSGHSNSASGSVGSNGQATISGPPAFGGVPCTGSATVSGGPNNASMTKSYSN